MATTKKAQFWANFFDKGEIKMKKSTFLLVMVMVFSFCFSAFAEEEMVDVRRSLLINGTHQRHVPFPFTVPSAGCGVTKVYEFIQSQSFFHQPASWELKFPGEHVSPGYYRFEVTEADPLVCAPIIDILETVPRLFLNSYSGSFFEVEPEDLGLLVKGGMEMGNIFNLSVNDREFSYYAVQMGVGTERTLDSFMRDTHFFSDTGDDMVGSIVADQRGFLKRKIIFSENRDPVGELVQSMPRIAFWNPWVRKAILTLQKEIEVLSPSDIVIHEGDVLILIKKENYDY